MKSPLVVLRCVIPEKLQFIKTAALGAMCCASTVGTKTPAQKIRLLPAPWWLAHVARGHHQSLCQRTLRNSKYVIHRHKAPNAPNIAGIAASDPETKNDTEMAPMTHAAPMAKQTMAKAIFSQPVITMALDRPGD